MEVRLYRQTWVGLPQTTRAKLVEAFYLRRDEGCMVNDGRLMSDGYSDNSLAGINIKSMQEFTGSKEKDFIKLFTESVNKVEGISEVVPTEGEPAVEEILPEITPVVEEVVAPLGKAKK